MAIKDEIKELIQVLQAQLVNFDQVPEDRLEAFLDVCVDEHDNYFDERIETRELQIALLCREADVRNKDCIGHCYTDLVWKDGEWVPESGADEEDSPESE